MQSEKIDRMRRAVLGRLESLERAGVMQLPAGEDSPATAASEGAGKPPVAAAKKVALAGPTAAVESAGSKNCAWQFTAGTTLFPSDEGSSPHEIPGAPTLAVLQQQVAGCTRCDELARTRTQTVFGVGNPKARLCFLGEAPGADEDRLGEPFVGRGGQLLTKIIEACRMNREDVYILNMIKCRPPGNRNPLPQELLNCRGYLECQFDLIQPEFICCLGAVAAQNLLNTTITIGKLRGKVHAYRGAKVICTYHPAFLLRSPSYKKEAWEDMKLLMREMDIQL
jgi:uracil-DNA glycosylase